MLGRGLVVETDPLVKGGVARAAEHDQVGECFAAQPLVGAVVYVERARAAVAEFASVLGEVDALLALLAPLRGGDVDVVGGFHWREG